jgi:hypothetical protein
MVAALGNKYAVGNRGYAGRKRYNLLSRALDHELRQIDPDAPGALTNAGSLARALVKQGKKGDVDAIRLIFDRSEGKLTDNVNLHLNDGPVPTITTDMHPDRAQQLYMETLNQVIDLDDDDYHEEEPPRSYRRKAIERVRR